jgi:hypothetical protein
MVFCCCEPLIFLLCCVKFQEGVNDMNHLFALLFVTFLSLGALANPICFQHGTPVADDQNRLFELITSRTSGPEALITGQVVKVLADEFGQNQHQKFVIDVSGRKVEIVNNLALSARVPVEVNQPVTVCGVFLPVGFTGAMIHWVHYDPAHRHEDGFIAYKNIVYGTRPGKLQFPSN